MHWAVAEKLLKEEYGFTATTADLMKANSSTGCRVFRIGCMAGHTVVLRAYPRDLPFPWWLGEGNLTDCIDKQAQLLTWLNQHSYPAPVIVATRDAKKYAIRERWCCLVTSFAEGQVLKVDPSNLLSLGMVLSNLHQLGLGSTELQRLSTWWRLPHASAVAISKLEAVRSVAPKGFWSVIESFISSLSAIEQFEALPCSIIHGDLWPGNAIKSTNKITVIDWECAGWGVAILDLASLLNDCLFSVSKCRNLSAQIELISAIITGYSSKRLLTDFEVASLTQAMRFTASYLGAIRVEQAATSMKMGISSVDWNYVESYFHESESNLHLVNHYIEGAALPTFADNAEET